ncbi:MAG TPA: DUF2244 domain-containing protein [Devosiaceae bacterium]
MQSPPLFSALLTPHRALSLRGIHLVVALAAILVSIPGLFFVSIGAWPIVGLMLVDVAALYWAMRHSLRDGDRYEEVTLFSDALRVRHVTPRGRERTYEFNPFWVRLEVDRDYFDRVVRIALRNRAEVLEIGAFLNPDDKASFAQVFGQALNRARG